MQAKEKGKWSGKSLFRWLNYGFKMCVVSFNFIFDSVYNLKKWKVVDHYSIIAEIIEFKF